jgi:dTDP-4-dehydrorhamnose 3,5-epimerase
MEFTETPLKGACVVRPRKIEDERGYFARGWCCNEFVQQGLAPAMVQLNVGFSHRRGTMRGMHYQLPPFAEVKIVRCTRGSIYDVIIDLRPQSATFTRHFSTTLTADDRKAIDWLYRSLAAGHADPEGTIVRWAGEYREKKNGLVIRGNGSIGISQSPPSLPFIQ